MLAGPPVAVRTSWIKRTGNSPLPYDEFRAFIEAEHATAYVLFSGNAQPDGFWIRVYGTRAHVETNLFEPPRLTMRSARAGEPALMRLLDGLTEGKDILKGSVAGFWRKLAGTSNYDGLPEMIARSYDAVKKRGPPPVSLDEIDAVALLVHQFTEDLPV
jgi:hypothetical protein